MSAARAPLSGQTLVSKVCAAEEPRPPGRPWHSLPPGERKRPGFTSVLTHAKFVFAHLRPQPSKMTPPTKTAIPSHSSNRPSFLLPTAYPPAAYPLELQTTPPSRVPHSYSCTSTPCSSVSPSDRRGSVACSASNATRSASAVSSKPAWRSNGEFEHVPRRVQGCRRDTWERRYEASGRSFVARTTSTQILRDPQPLRVHPATLAHLKAT